MSLQDFANITFLEALGSFAAMDARATPDYRCTVGRAAQKPVLCTARKSETALSAALFA